MRQGFVKAAAVTPKIKVADTKYNAELILDMMKESTRQGAKIVVFPELCLTGYTCQDLFLQERLLQGAKDALMKLVKESASLDAIFFVGLPFEILGKLYNVAAVFSHGEVLGLVPKSYLPNYNEFYERDISYPEQSLRQRWFCRTEAVFLRTGICFLSVSRCRNSESVWNCVRICGHRIRRVSPMHWRGRLFW